MARTRRDGKTDSRSARLRLKANREPYWTSLAPGEALGYYRPASGGAGTWWARFRQADRRYRKSALGTADDYSEAEGKEVLSFAQAQGKAREWFERARLAMGEEAPRRGPYTVADAWEDYRKDCIRRGVKRMDRMECAARLHILPALGAVEVERLSQSRIETWHHDLSLEGIHKKPRLGQPVKAPRPKTEDERRKRKASANRVLTILKSALNLAKRKRRVICPGDTWREVEPFGHVDAPRVRFLLVEEQSRLTNVCPPDFRRLVQGALFTGGRVGELARLRAKDFDTQNGSVFFEKTKNGKSRHVYLTEEGQSFFKSLVAGKSADDLLFTHEAFPDQKRKDPKTLKPISKVQRGWKTAEQGRPMRAACEAAKVGAMSFHELRHTYASTLINAGVPLAFIAEQLGHSDSRMVEKHYGHLAPSAVADAIRKLSPKLGIYTPGNVEALEIKKA